jgi:hypothetical protein
MAPVGVVGCFALIPQIDHHDAFPVPMGRHSTFVIIKEYKQ